MNQALFYWIIFETFLNFCKTESLNFKTNLSRQSHFEVFQINLMSIPTLDSQTFPTFDKDFMPKLFPTKPQF